jgi:chromosome partitioning protein
MRNSIAVMNTKGGVGKSTLVMAVAETMSVHHGKNVLVARQERASGRQ